MATKRIFLDGETTSPEDFVEYFNDFLDYAAADWTITTTEAGAGSATEAVGDAANGVLVVTNDAADDDADFLQYANETFKFVSGKKLYGAMRFSLSDATQSDFVFGLQITDTTPLAVTDGIYFQKDDGDANLDFHVTKDSTATDVTAIATLENDTFVKVAFYYDGGDKILLFVDDALVGSAAVTNAPDDEELTISFGIQNGEAVAKVLNVDFIRIVAER
jgi:hypothetical protein